MAITFVNQIPAGRFLPSANPINITVNSNNTGKCNFRYVCDLWIDGVNSFRFKLFPDPQTGFGFFQLSDVISDYLREYWTQLQSAGMSAGTSNSEKSIVEVYCRFGEEYDNSSTCDGPLTLYPNLATSNTFRVYFGGLDYEVWPQFDHLTYIVDWATSYNGKRPKFMTNRPRGSVTLSWGDSYYLDIMASSAPNPATSRVAITKDDSSTIYLNIPPLTSFRKFRVACGPFNINKALGTSYINSSTSWYEVWLEDSGKQLTERFRIDLTSPGKFRTRIGFIGHLGSPEYTTFYLRNKKAFTSDRKTYRKFLTSHKGGGNLTYDVGDESLKVWGVESNEIHSVSTFVDKETSSWLWELWLSTRVWVETKPRYWNFRVFREDNTPTSRVLFWLPDGHNIEAGDSFFCIPENKPENSDFIDRFTAVSVNGNVVDCGLTWNIFNLTDSACGWIVKDETPVRLPIVISDNVVEAKQKEGKQIQYGLNYQMSFQKTTLRG